MTEIRKKILKNFKEHHSVLEKTEATFQATEKTAEKIISCFKNNGKLLICGNGGSASDSNHLAAEFVNKYMKDRKPLPAISLAANTSNITAIGNDYSFDYTFSKQVEALGNGNDVLICISTSGKSKNIIEALKTAKKKKIFAVLFTGSSKTQAGELADIVIAVPSTSSPRILEMHLLLYHCICEIVESEFE